MKVALCLSGQPRDIEIGINSIKENIIFANPMCDIHVFCHYWFDESLIDQVFDSAQINQQHKMGRYSKNTHSIIEKLNPEDIYFEQPRNFSEYSKLTTELNAQQDKLASMFYSMWVSNQMKNCYESKNNLQFDLVIRTRYDLFFFNPVILEHYKLLKDHNIIVSDKFQGIRKQPFNGNLSLTDLFAISNSNFINCFCDVYPNFENIHKEISLKNGKTYGENILGQQVRINNKIKIYSCDKIDFNLVRNVQ